ncbi:uncharacterized protein LOC133886821 [Phragmites australis]|uniref:uncharacterized protein LOC133886821 n=1 Tax=Phragmites australis TaxID=29695 RepID=UPI002D7654C2|nr:uncharacterized protein LOC133886821 [Phragmites australis]
MGSTNPMIIESSHSNDNNNYETSSVLNSLPWVKNDPATNRDPRTVLVIVVNSQINNCSTDTSNGGHASEENKKMKGKLGFVSTAADKLLTFQLVLIPVSLYALNQMSLRESQKRGMDTVLVLSTISTLLLVLMASYASCFKESELIVDVPFEILSILLLFNFTLLDIELCIILQNYAHIPIGVVLPIGITFFSVVLTWVIYLERPKFLKKWTKFVRRKI